MRKLTKIAFALLLAAAAILTGCTKDFKSEVNKFEPRVTKLENAVTALQAFQTAAQAAIDKNTTALSGVQKDVDDLSDAIEALATAHEADILELTNEITEAVTDIYDKISAASVDVAGLKFAKQIVIGALEELKEEVAALGDRIKSIVFVPGLESDLYKIEIEGVDTCKIFAGAYSISPAKMASSITVDDLDLYFREGKSKADVAESGKIFKIEAKEGNLIVYATANDMADVASGNKLYQNLTFKGADDAGVVYEVASDYSVVLCENAAVTYGMAYNGEFLSPMEVRDSIDYTALAPVEMLKGIEPVIEINTQSFTMEQIKERLNLAEAPKVTLTDSVIVAALPFRLTDTTKYIMDFKTDGFTSAQLVGEESSVKVKYLINGVNHNLEAASYLTICRHDIVLDPIEAQIINWDYVHSAGVDYVAENVVVPEQVYKSSTVVLGSEKIYKTADPKKTAVAGKVNVINPTYSKGKIVAAIGICDVVPGKNEVDYTYIQNAYDDTLNYVAQIPFTVMPRPLDKEDLQLKDTVITFSSAGTQINIKPVDTALTEADTTEYYCGLGAADAARDLAKLRSAFATGATGNTNIKTLKVDGKSIAKSNIAGYVTVSIAYDEATKKDNSVLTVKNKLTAGQEAEIVFEVKAFGVTYTFTQNVAVDALPYNLVVDPLFVDANMNVKTKGELVEIATDSYKYELTAHDMANYVNFKGEIPENESKVKIVYKFYNEGDSTGVNAKAGINALPAAPASVSLAPGTKTLASAPFDWGTFSANKLHASAYLTLDGKRVGDSIALNIISVQPVTDFVGGSISAERTSGSDLVINLWSDMSAVGCLADTSIIVKKAANITDALNNAKIDYGQALEDIDITKAKATLADGTAYAIDPALFVVDNAAGTLTIKKECGIFTQPVTITIPVALDYLLDYQHKQALKSEVKVTVTQK